MIVSFHPIIVADRNILCAGRLPDETDLAAIRGAAAVILPQGCSEALYRMARENCALVFPNFDVRFDYPGKRGQVRLFRQLKISHPQTRLFDSLADYQANHRGVVFPCVLKLDWGGQGETVYFVEDQVVLDEILYTKVAACEKTGQCGFLIQQFIPSGGRSLRVVVIGTFMLSYWRIQPNGRCFGTSVAHGARIDHDSDPELQYAAKRVVENFCGRTGLQMAGFDFIFSSCGSERARPEPLLLEINYFFGRTGLGGSAAYYRILESEVAGWLRLHFSG